MKQLLTMMVDREVIKNMIFIVGDNEKPYDLQI